MTLDASDVNLLIEGALELARGARNAHDQRQINDDHLREHLDELVDGHLSELVMLAEELAGACPSPLDPPFDLTRTKAQLLRQVMSDLSGYQRRDLTPRAPTVATEPQRALVERPKHRRTRLLERRRGEAASRGSFRRCSSAASANRDSANVRLFASISRPAGTDI